MKKKLFKSGNSVALILPREFLKELNVSDNDEVELILNTTTKEIIIRNETAPQTNDQLLETIVRDAVVRYQRESK